MWEQQSAKVENVLNVIKNVKAQEYIEKMKTKVYTEIYTYISNYIKEEGNTSLKTVNEAIREIETSIKILHLNIITTKDDVKELDTNPGLRSMEEKWELCNKEIDAIDVRLEVIITEYDNKSKDITDLMDMQKEQKLIGYNTTSKPREKEEEFWFGNKKHSW